MSKAHAPLDPSAPLQLSTLDLQQIFQHIRPALSKSTAEPVTALIPDPVQQLLTLVRDVVRAHYSTRDTDPAAPAGSQMAPLILSFSDRKWGPYTLLFSPYPENRCFTGPDKKVDPTTFDPDLHDTLRQMYCDLHEVAGETVILVEEGTSFSVTCKTPHSLFALFHNLVVNDTFPGPERDRLNLLESRFVPLLKTLNGQLANSDTAPSYDCRMA